MFEIGVHTTCFTLGLKWFFQIDYSSIKYHVYQLKIYINPTFIIYLSETKVY